MPVPDNPQPLIIFMSSQSHTQTITELGGIPSEAGRLSLLLNDKPSDTSTPARDARISSVPLAQSRALPAPRVHENPANWPVARGTPDFVPRETDIDIADRPLGANNGEFVFLTFMLSGVQIVSASNYIWRRTVGRFTDRVFRYKIGGHW